MRSEACDPPRATDLEFIWADTVNKVCIDSTCRLCALGYTTNIWSSLLMLCDIESEQNTSQ